MVKISLLNIPIDLNTNTYFSRILDKIVTLNESLSDEKFETSSKYSFKTFGSKVKGHIMFNYINSLYQNKPVFIENIKLIVSYEKSPIFTNHYFGPIQMDNLLMSHLVSLSPEELDLNSLIYERYDKIKNIPIKESLVETISLYLNSLPTKNSYELAYQRIADDYLHWKFNN